MKQLLFLLSMIVCFCASAQIYTRPNTTYGVISYRVASEKEIRIPTGTDSLGVPNTTLRMSGFRYDTLNHILYYWKPETSEWSSITSGSGSSLDTLTYYYTSTGAEDSIIISTGISYDPASYTLTAQEMTSTGDVAGLNYIVIYDGSLNRYILKFPFIPLSGTTYKYSFTFIKPAS